MPTKPKLSREASTRAGELSKTFAANLRGVATHIAAHHKAASVSAANVDSAYETLSKAGLAHRRWAERPESFTALGGFLFGFAFSCPAGVELFFDSELAESIARGLLIGFAISGGILVALGWFIGKLPAAPREPLSIGRRIWHVAYWVIIVLLLIAAGFTLYLRMSQCGSGGCGGNMEIPAAESAKDNPRSSSET